MTFLPCIMCSIILHIGSNRRISLFFFFMAEWYFVVYVLLPAKLGSFFLQINIKIKSQWSVVDREILFLKWTNKWEKKKRGNHLPGGIQKVGCILKGETKDFHKGPLLVWARNCREDVPHWWFLNQLGNGWTVLVQPIWDSMPKISVGLCGLKGIREDSCGY